ERCLMAEENKNKKSDSKRPKPSYYWIYAAIIMLFFAIQIFGGGSWSQPQKTTQSEFEEFLKQDDVEKVDIINKKIAKVYLTDAAIENEAHAKNGETPSFLAQEPDDP